MGVHGARWESFAQNTVCVLVSRASMSVATLASALSVFIKRIG